MKLRWLLAAALLPACAHIEAPPGGPEDLEGPRLLTTRPDSMARLESFPGPVVLVFDEGLSEQNVREAVDVSPRTSAVVVDKSGDELRVNLRRGWERGRIYQVSVEPLIRDRFNNALAQRIHLVFSTGPEIPETRLSGRVVERQTASVARLARVDAILLPDSLVYTTRSDSVGSFRFERIPVGSYRVVAYNDPNANRELDGSEPRDTASARVEGLNTDPLALSIVSPDSTAPRLSSGSGEEVTVSLRFDDFLDPAVPAEQIQVRVVGADSVPIPVAALAVGQLTAPDSAGADSARAGSARADSARADSVPAVPVPSQTLVIKLSRPLAPDALHRVTVTGVRNLVGLVGGGTVEFRTPRARPAPVTAPDSPAEQAPPAGPPAVPPPTDPPAQAP